MGGTRKRRRPQHDGVKFMAEDAKLHCYNPDDRISQLPDDILRLVFPFLTIKEAVITSLLSRRWRYLWRSASVLRLDFGSSIVPNSSEDTKLHAKRNSEYVKRVSKVLRSYKGRNAGEFSLRLPLSQKNTRFIDWCFRFALSRKVRKLEFDFSPRPSHGYHSMPVLRVRALDQDFHNLTLQKKAKTSALLPVSWSFPGFKSLTSLSFNDLKMGGDVLEGLLSNCPLLESLVLSRVRGLGYVKVVGPSLRLKYLEILYCPDMRNIQIYDTPLVSLKRRGPWAPVFKMAKVPSLVGLSIPARWEEGCELDMFSSHLKHLELISYDVPVDPPFISQISKLTELRELGIAQRMAGGLVHFVPVIGALPQVHKIVIRMVKQCHTLFESGIRELRKGTGDARLAHVKVLVFEGYGGRMNEDDFILHVVENAVKLETVIIDLSCQTESGFELEHNACSKRFACYFARVREHAKHWLGGILAPETKLVIQ